MANPKPGDPLLNPPAPTSNRGDNGGRSVPWSPLIGFVGLAVNFALCIHRAEEDRGAIAFVTFAYLNLLVLFWCIRQFDQVPHGSVARGRIRVAVWILATSLTAVFTWKVAALMPLPVAVVAWAMASATVVGGFYGFFIHEDK